MSVYFCIPSARPPAEVVPVLLKWAKQGYNMALFCDTEQDLMDKLHGINVGMDGKLQATGAVGQYPGYANAVNQLALTVLAADPSAQWIVTGGDDVHPDPDRTAEEIATETERHFGGTFGIMQCTGDRFGENEPWARMKWPNAPAYIDRVCGSPWMGREFCLRMYGGHGPLFSGYTHMFVDEELQAVATKLGVFQQRRDLIQYHDHVHRNGPAEVPQFLQHAYSRDHWQHSELLFNHRKAAGFPGHEPLMEVNRESGS